MPRILQDRYEIELVINGEPALWDQLELEEYSMHESVRQKYPTAELSFTSSPYYILINPIIDGTPIVVTLNDTQIDPPTGPMIFRMRAFNTRFKSLSDQFKQYVSLYLDAPDLHIARSKSYGKTTSSNAIAAAAIDAGLSPEVDPAADVQVWLRPNIKGSDFIYKTSRHSYAGPFSCFVTGIGAQHTLRHYNIHERTGGNTNWLFKNPLEEYYTAAPNEIIYEGAVFSTKSGTNNAYAGYGRTYGTYHLESGFQAPKFDMAQIGAGKQLNVARQMLGSQRAQTLPYDSDNCQVGSTLIPTERGLLRIDEIARKEGGEERDIDILVGGMIKPARAVKWYYSGVRETLNIRTDVGNFVHCTYTHPNLVLYEGKLTWKKASDCKVGDVLCMNSRQIVRSEKLRLDLKTEEMTRAVATRPRNDGKEINKPTEMNTDLASLVGYVLSEGNVVKNSIKIWNTNKNLINKVRSLVEKIFNFTPLVTEHSYRGVGVCYCVGIYSKIIYSYLCQLGVGPVGSHEKEVPWSILQADGASQLAFLASYLEGDGSIDNKTGRICWYSTSEKLLSQIQLMLNSYGLFPRSHFNNNYRGFNEKKEARIGRVVLNGSQSGSFFKAIEPYMLTKKLDDIGQRQDRKYGVPASYWISLIKSRKVGWFEYLNDSSEVVTVKWSDYKCVNALHRKFFLYESWRAGVYDSFLGRLKMISETAYNDLIKLLNLEFFYTPIVSITSQGEGDVYDLSMEENAEPAFIANGLIVHNTHNSYMQADVQNTAIKSFFSVEVEIITRYGRGPILLDYCTLEPSSMALNGVTTGSIITPWAGGYYISEIHTMVTPAFVGKKYILLREGLNYGGDIDLGLVGWTGESPPQEEGQPAQPIQTGQQ